MNLDLSRYKAMVCGASKGIGRAVAHELAALGASVTALARNERELQKLVEELQSAHGGDYKYLAADMAQGEKIRATIDAHVKAHGPFHILVNNSGGPAAGPAREARTEDFIAAFTQHLIGNQIMVQSVIDVMKAESYGRIVNIISTSVKQPVPGLGVSNTIRGAVANWAKTLAGELAPYGITVNNVLPGSTETERLWSLFRTRAADRQQSYDEVVAYEKSIIPAKRFGKPEEVAQAVAFLASPAAAYINGINLPVDGGRTSSL
jgi:3-oxoacyl-[acyl-carrier protein] reductase